MVKKTLEKPEKKQFIIAKKGKKELNPEKAAFCWSMNFSWVIKMLKLGDTSVVVLLLSN